MTKFYPVLAEIQLITPGSEVAVFALAHLQSVALPYVQRRSVVTVLALVIPNHVHVQAGLEPTSNLCKDMKGQWMLLNVQYFEVIVLVRSHSLY